MKNKILYTILILLIIAFLTLAIRFIWGGPEDSWICQEGGWVKHGNPKNPMPTDPCDNKITGEQEPQSYIYKDLIKIDLPLRSQKISSPLTVKGEARGNWYFEAFFLVKVLDEDGTVLGSNGAEARGEWMSTEFVPFVGEITFDQSSGKTGSVVFIKNNPSGLPGQEDSISIPVVFK